MTDLFDQPTRRAARQQNKTKQRIRTAVILVLSLGLATFAGFWAAPKVAELFDNAPADFPGPGEGEVVVEIPMGSSGDDIADLLLESNVVASKDAALTALRSNVESSRIQAGAYRLLEEMRAEEAVAWLLLPSSRVEISITIPEGFVYWQVFERMESIFGFDYDEIEAVAGDPAAIGLPDEAQGMIEGWIAPATYSFSPSATPQDVLSRMVAQTVSNLNAASVPAEEWQDVLNKASIVEKEGLPAFFGEVARVIDNRLTLENTGTNGRLQMDSTVNYGLHRTGGVPTPEENQIDTEWNTYTRAGLPLTPIGAPSIQAIRAVLDPPEGPWLYFVTINLDTGETLFAATKEEHDQNVDLLRQWRAENPAESNDDEEGGNQ